MAKRELEEINAGSMADIAFLLLIFFLITTTMNFPKAIEENLPRKSEQNVEIKIKKRNILKVFANFRDDILINDERGRLEQIREKVVKFYDHAESNNNLPALISINKPLAQERFNLFDKKVNRFQVEADKGEFIDGRFNSFIDSVKVYSDSLAKWDKRLMTVKMIGDYKTVNDMAMISIQFDNATKFKTYLNILDEVMLGLQDLRSELCMKKFGVPLSKLNEKNDEGRNRIRALREVFPKRVMKLPARNAG